MPYELYSLHPCLHICVFEESATLTHSPHHVPVREQEASLCDPPNCECPTQLDREPASLSWVFFFGNLSAPEHSQKLLPVASLLAHLTVPCTQ